MYNTLGVGTFSKVRLTKVDNPTENKKHTFPLDFRLISPSFPPLLLAPFPALICVCVVSQGEHAVG